MKMLLLPALVVGFMLYPVRADAHTLSHRPFSTMTVRQVQQYQLRSLAHARGVIRFWERHRPVVRDRQLAAVRPPYEVWWHMKQAVWLRRELRQTRHVLAVPAPSAVGHVALWECIHRGEGAWNSQTGNGYYGGLQMTYGWGGRVANAALLSPAAQMAAAEAGYRASGYSRAWLRGQWPNTSPPCLGYS